MIITKTIKRTICGKEFDFLVLHQNNKEPDLTVVNKYIEAIDESFTLIMNNDIKLKVKASAARYGKWHQEHYGVEFLYSFTHHIVLKNKEYMVVPDAFWIPTSQFGYEDGNFVSLSFFTHADRSSKMQYSSILVKNKARSPRLDSEIRCYDKGFVSLFKEVVNKSNLLESEFSNLEEEKKKAGFDKEIAELVKKEDSVVKEREKKRLVEKLGTCKRVEQDLLESIFRNPEAAIKICEWVNSKNNIMMRYDSEDFREVVNMFNMGKIHDA